MDDQTTPFYRGPEGFKEVLANERLARPGRVFRVYNYARFSGDEKLYVLGTEGKLFDPSNKKEVNPQEVFSRENAPDGWSVETFMLDSLPQDEIYKILKI